ncbi:MAG: hypothetical protein JNK94_02320, partial [Hyphomonadaceae bacterium]|nr:hypothetical protein [Hyphomonadaceae bacterium]
MSRLGLPRRFAALAAASAAALLAHEAAAQAGAAIGRDRDTSARTTIGTPLAQACSQSVAAGDSSDAALATCDRAFSERLNRGLIIATHINRGALHLRRRNGEAALADFDAVIALERRHAEAHLNRGAALIMLGRPGPAVASITEALSLGVAEPHKAYF